MFGIDFDDDGNVIFDSLGVFIDYYFLYLLTLFFIGRLMTSYELVL